MGVIASAPPRCDVLLLIRQISKKPVVAEEYDEIVFSEPPEAFYKRVTAIPPQPAPASVLSSYFMTHSHKEELAKIQVDSH